VVAKPPPGKGSKGLGPSAFVKAVTRLRDEYMRAGYGPLSLVGTYLLYKRRTSKNVSPVHVGGVTDDIGTHVEL